MTTYVLGIDGGQSSTVAAIGDERGRVLGTGSAGPSDDVGEAVDTDRMAAACERAAFEALRAAGLQSGTRVAAAAVGLSGYDGVPYGRLPELGAERTRFYHDADIAHVGALGRGPGVTVLAGTGSVALGSGPQGRSATVGGWGYLFGDEGSAFWIAREALAVTMRSRSNGPAGGPPGPLEEAALATFGLPDLRRLARACYRNDIGRPALAAFAPQVLALVRQDPTARVVVEAAVAALASLAVDAAAAAGCSGAVEVALTGGMFEDDSFYDAVAVAVVKRLPGAQVRRARYAPVYGALLLAYDDADCHVGALTQAGGRGAA